MTLRSTAVLFLVAALALGCQPSQPSTGTAPQSTDTAAAPAPESTGPLEIAVIPKGLAHQFWLTVKAGAEAAAKEVGAEIVWQGPPKETEVAKQISIVQDMISRGVDGIALAACDENALVQTVQQAMDKGIPVVTMDSGVKSDLPVSFVATDNVAGARLAADTLVDLIGGSGKVGVIPFVRGAATSELREQGFKEGIAAHDGVEIAANIPCDSDVAKAMNVTQDMVTSHPDLKGIFATNEPAAIGAAQALKAIGKAGEVKVVAFDAADEEIAALKDGALQALIVQNPFQMGYLAVKTCADAIAGKEVEKRIDTGVTVVTMENFNDPEVQKLLYPLGEK